jgi:cytoskeletal protein CcmA (bactofilin family)
MKNLIDEPRARVPDAKARHGAASLGESSQPRRLEVGKGITLSGEITSCDILVVEGTVKADISRCKEMQIAKGGLYIGTATVENAEILGRFEGELNVSVRLVLRSSGEVAAKVRYGEIEVEAGGDLSGDVRKEVSPTTIVRRA